MEWIDDNPNIKDKSTINNLDIRHTDNYDDSRLDEYRYLSPKAMIHHVYSFPEGKGFMASLTSLGSMCNGRFHYNYDNAKTELNTMINDWIEKIESY